MSMCKVRIPLAGDKVAFCRRAKAMESDPSTTVEIRSLDDLTILLHVEWVKSRL